MIKPNDIGIVFQRQERAWERLHGLQINARQIVGVDTGDESLALLRVYDHAMRGEACIRQPYARFDPKGDGIDDGKKRGRRLRDIEVLVNQWQGDYKDAMGNWIEL